MQMRSIRRRSVDGSMTIVGDIAQATNPWAPDDWSAMAAALRIDHEAQVHELGLGYRVPRQIYQHAANLLKHAAPGSRRRGSCARGRPTWSSSRRPSTWRPR